MPVVDNYTSKCLAIDVGQSLKGEDVVRVLEQLRMTRGLSLPKGVLSVNRAAGAIDDDAFEQLLQHIKTRAGGANLANRFAQKPETEHGYEDET